MILVLLIQDLLISLRGLDYKQETQSSIYSDNNNVTYYSAERKFTARKNSEIYHTIIKMLDLRKESLCQCHVYQSYHFEMTDISYKPLPPFPYLSQPR